VDLPRLLLFRRLLIDRQKAAALPIEEVRGHDQEFARDLEVQHLECVDEREVLLGDPLQGDLVDVHLVLLHEVKQEIERTFEDLEFDFVFLGHALGRRG
jgi:hypothetical protein